MEETDPTARARHHPPREARALRRRDRVGKYRIVRRISTGGFAEVYEAEDTIEGIRVALRIPRPDMVDAALLETFKAEVRLLSKLDHPNILQIKSADLIDGLFVVAARLGEGTLGDVMDRRLTTAVALSYVEQLLMAVAHVHEKGIVHCDIKPENVIVFPDQHLRLTDFGIARIALRSTLASGSGTVGYLAPEQALGRPTLHSDVFSVGLVAWQLLTGEIPEWPFEWPFPGADRAKRKISVDLVQVLRKSLAVDQRRRYASAGAMLSAFETLKRSRRLLPKSGGRRNAKRPASQDLRELRRTLFLRRFRKTLELKHECGRCGFPMSEAMRGCPACTNAPARYSGPTSMPARCPRCSRGRKLDWRFCAWCYGAGFSKVATREYSDRRYTARCSKPACGKPLAPFMRYCPWCRSKVTRKWTFEGADGRCTRCGCGILKELWKRCPWCTARIPEGSRR